jgi:hypothetical protein
MSDSCDSKRRRIESPADATISSRPDDVLQQCISFVGPGHCDMLLEILAGFKISTRSSTRAKQPGKVPLLLLCAPNFV